MDNEKFSRFWVGLMCAVSLLFFLMVRIAMKASGAEATTITKVMDVSVAVLCVVAAVALIVESRLRF